MERKLHNPVNPSPFAPEIEAFGGNQSGIRPIGTKCLVQTDRIKEQSKGGIFITEQVSDQQNLAICTGWLVAKGGGAFTDFPHGDRPWVGDVPKVGDRIHLAKYSGLLVTGDDGRSYRLCHDTEICGIAANNNQSQKTW